MTQAMPNGAYIGPCPACRGHATKVVASLAGHGWVWWRAYCARCGRTWEDRRGADGRAK